MSALSANEKRRRGRRDQWLVLTAVIAPVAVAGELGFSAMAVLTALYLLAQVGLLLYYREAVWTWMSRMRRSEVARGVVTGYEPSARRDAPPGTEDPTVRFVTAAGQLVERQVWSLGHRGEIGATTGVRYDPVDGTVLHIVERERVVVALLVPFAFVLVVSNMAMAVFVAFQLG